MSHSDRPHGGRSQSHDDTDESSSDTQTASSRNNDTFPNSPAAGDEQHIQEAIEDRTLQTPNPRSDHPPQSRPQALEHKSRCRTPKILLEYAGHSIMIRPGAGRLHLLLGNGDSDDAIDASLEFKTNSVEREFQDNAARGKAGLNFEAGSPQEEIPDAPPREDSNKRPKLDCVQSQETEAQPSRRRSARYTRNPRRRGAANTRNSVQSNAQRES